MPTRIGVCNLCEAICGLELTIEGAGSSARVTAIRGNPADPLSRGYICPKGVSLADVHADPDRLRRPVRRVGTGADAEWVEIGWDEALDRVADGLARALNEHGRDAVGVYLGNPNAHALGSAHARPRDGQDLAHAQPFQRLVGGPDPPPARGVAALRPPAAAADPRHRPHVLLPRVRGQPDGLQRLPDDRARLPEPIALPQGPRRPDGRRSTRVGRRRPRSPASTSSSGPAPTPWSSWPWCARSSTRA